MADNELPDLRRERTVFEQIDHEIHRCSEDIDRLTRLKEKITADPNAAVLAQLALRCGARLMREST